MRPTIACLSRLLVLVVLVTPFAGRAQQAMTPKIGVILPAGIENTPGPRALRQGMTEHGYVDGVTWKFVDENRGRDAVIDLIGSKVNVLVAVGPASLTWAHSVTKVVPIVAIDLESDPVASGYAASYARPGGNVTGVFLDMPELAGKWVELLKEVSRVSRIAVLWNPHAGVPQHRALEVVAAQIGVQLNIRSVANPQELQTAFRVWGAARIDALIVLSSPFTYHQSDEIAALAAKHRWPAISMFPEFTAHGGLLSYGVDVANEMRRLPVFIDRVVKGIQPGQVPIERPTRFVLTINRKTAKAFGLKLPGTLLQRADYVID